MENAERRLGGDLDRYRFLLGLLRHSFDRRLVMLLKAKIGDTEARLAVLHRNNLQRHRPGRNDDGSIGPGAQIRFAGWSLNLASRDLLSPAGEGVPLTAAQFDLLAAFAQNPYRVMSRDRLLDHLSRHRHADLFDRTIDVQVSRLRRKMGDDAKNPVLIKTVRGGGYLFAPPIPLPGRGLAERP
jgi:two-component system, OmpR family, response regulator